MGGQNVAWQPSRQLGQSSGDAASATARTGPRAAAQTGVPLRPSEREPGVVWKPRRHSLGGVSHGVAEAKLIAMRLGKPPAGYGRWSLQLLADALVALEVVSSICPETVRKTLKKTA